MLLLSAFKCFIISIAPNYFIVCHYFVLFFSQVDEVTDLLASFTSLSLQKQNLGDR